MPFLESLENKPGVGFSPVIGFYILELLLEHEEIKNVIKNNLIKCFIIMSSYFIICVLNFLRYNYRLYIFRWIGIFYYKCDMITTIIDLETNKKINFTIKMNCEFIRLLNSNSWSRFL